MSGPFHERAICACGFTTPCSFGNLFHLSHNGRFINVCPDCGQPKSSMKVRVLRWHNRTWRDREDQPFDGIEPPQPQPRRPGATAAWIIIALLTLFGIALLATLI